MKLWTNRATADSSLTAEEYRALKHTIDGGRLGTADDSIGSP